MSPPSPSLCPLSLASPMQVVMDQKGIKRKGGAKKFGWDINGWHGWGRTKKKKNYTTAAREGERNQSSPAEWRQWEILKHITWMWSFFFFFGLLWVERVECVWDREDRQKATGQASCPGPRLGQTGSWIWAYQTGWPFGFWLPGVPSCMGSPGIFPVPGTHSFKVCARAHLAYKLISLYEGKRNPLRHHSTKVSKRKHPLSSNHSLLVVSTHKQFHQTRRGSVCRCVDNIRVPTSTSIFKYALFSRLLWRSHGEMFHASGPTSFSDKGHSALQIVSYSWETYELWGTSQSLSSYRKSQICAFPLIFSSIWPKSSNLGPIYGMPQKNSDSVLKSLL